jgi:hypothetical protein
MLSLFSFTNQNPNLDKRGSIHFDIGRILALVFLQFTWLQRSLLYDRYWNFTMLLRVTVTWLATPFPLL